MQARKIKLIAGFLLFASAVLTYTFSAEINLNSGIRTEFGLGVEQTVVCDTYISTSLTSKLDSETGKSLIESLTLSDLSLSLRNRTLKAYLIGKDKSILSKPIQFSVGSDGLTYTTNRSNVVRLEAFEPGAGGSKTETGTSSITFNNLIQEENPPIQADDFARVALETSGQGKCSVPANPRAVEVYVDAPNVQGSYVAENFPAASLTDDYNAATTDLSNCPVNGQVGTYAYTTTNESCKILLGTHDGNYVYGGALTTSSSPTTSGTKSPSVGVFTGSGTTITFTSRKNYIGFWWSAGSTGNTIDFYRGSFLVATMTGDEVYSAIPKNASVLTALNGTTTYTKSNYYGHPKNQASEDVNEPFVFIHAFAVNGFNFDKIKISMSGNGFEYDNLTVANLSTTQLVPKRTLVFIRGYDYTG
ncbi:hypothetical protein MCEMRE182_00820 [Candidatus Nanopelagicaceae bacterium]